ncbi:hypothetical protein P879_05154 [Paragonimus westermani]|uniref:Transmembrane protein 131-like N-terminal domain-containing protein n=1 Tax=Paragonimus westermani TaxID=34504 RepID=A0A8T0D2A5_9TREM|nr:hypothetical protein P879_05154 [Paragonimus westermani]
MFSAITAFMIIFGNAFGLVACDNAANFDGEMLNLLDDINEFYSHKFSEEYRIFNKMFVLRVTFKPNILDFGDRPVFKASSLEVSLTNLEPDHTFEIRSTFGNHEAFLWSKFNRTMVAPLASTSFNLTFIPQKMGYVEGTIFIATSHGLLRYQVFGSGYMDTDELLPVVHRKTTSSAKFLTVEIFNPSIFPLKVENLAFYSPSNAVHNNTSLVANEPWKLYKRGSSHDVLYPQRATEIFSLPLADDNFSAEGHFLVFSTRLLTDRANLDSECPGYRCLRNISPLFEKVNSYSFMVVALHSRYSTTSELFAASSFLHFGTVMSTSGSVTLPLQMLCRSDCPVVITHVATDFFDAALSIRLVNRTIAPDAAGVQTVALFTASAANISSSYALSGFITALTDTNAFVKVPYYVKLVRGAFITRTSNHTFHNEPFGLHYQYFLLNIADFPLLVLPPQLPKAVKNNLVVHNRTSAVVLSPNEERLLLEVSLPYSSPAHIINSVTIITNVSVLHLSIDAFSGFVHVRVPEARLIGDVFDFGHVLVNNVHRTNISLFNDNSFNVMVDCFMLSINSFDAETFNRLDLTSQSACPSVCHLTPSIHTCVSCIKSVPAHSNLTLEVHWGGFNVPGKVTGVIILRTAYHRFAHPFRFFVGVGELLMIPNRIVVNGLFPGKRVHRNLIIQSNYTSHTELTRLQLLATTRSLPRSIRLLSDSAAPTQGGADLLPSAIQLTPKKSTLVGSLIFDPSLDCSDWFSKQASGDRSEALDELCYTGFTLDSEAGRAFIRAMSRDRSDMNSSSDWMHTFHSGMQATAQLYIALRGAWVAKQNSLSSAKSKTQSGTLDAYVSFGASMEQTQFLGDLSVSFIWPRIVPSSSKRPSSCTVNSPVSKRVMQSDAYSSFAFGQALRAHFPTTTWHDRLFCDLVIINPSDLPLLIQPVLLDAVYDIHTNVTEYMSPASPLGSFLRTLGQSASPDVFSKLSNLIVGTFSMQFLDPSSLGDAWTYHYDQEHLEAPNCCPTIFLPPNIGRATLRLTFTPDAISAASALYPTRVVSEASHNLLFIRNNLTALEPVWLTARQGRAALAVGVLPTQSKVSAVVSSTSPAYTSGYPNESESVHVLFEALWIRPRENNTHVELIFSEQTEGVTDKQSLSPDQSLTTLNFDFEKKFLWPFCTVFDDPNSAYSVLNTMLPVGQQFQSATTRESNKPTDMLVTLSIRRLLVLINTGDVPIEVPLLVLGPDSNFHSLFDRAAGTVESDPLACIYSSFTLTPCLAPKDYVGASERARSKPTSLVIKPGAHLPLEVTYHPDFVRTSVTARVWILAFPQNTPSGNTLDAIWNVCVNHTDSGSSFAECLTSSMLHMPLVRLSASFPWSFLKVCLDVLPRPWIEMFMWTPILLLFSINLCGVLFLGLGDAIRMHGAHLRLRQAIDRLPVNALPDPSRVFSFEHLVNGTPFSNVDSVGIVHKSSGARARSKSRDMVEQRIALKKTPLSLTPSSTCVATVEPDPETPWSNHVMRVAFTALFFVGLVVRFIGLFFSLIVLNPFQRIRVLIYRSKSPVIRSSSSTDSSPVQKGSRSINSNQVSPQTILSANDKFVDSDESSARSVRTDSKACTKSQSKHSTSDSLKSIGGTREDLLRWTSSFENRSSDLLKAPARRKRPSKTETSLTSEIGNTQLFDQSVKTDRESSSPTHDTQGREGHRSSTGISRSKGKDAPMSEAKIAAAVRATMRLAEETSSQARRKVAVTKQNGQDKTRVSYSSASSSSGPDQDGVKNMPLNLLRSKLEHSVAVKGVSKTVAVAGYKSDVRSNEEPLHSSPIDSHAQRDPNRSSTNAVQPDISSDHPQSLFGSINPFMGHSVQGVGEPELEICWPSIRDNNGTGFTAPPDTHVPRPWDEAVAEVTNLCDPESVCWYDSSSSSSSSRDSPDVAMHKIAAESQAFADAFMYCVTEPRGLHSLNRGEQRICSQRSTRTMKVVPSTTDPPQVSGIRPTEFPGLPNSRISWASGYGRPVKHDWNVDNVVVLPISFPGAFVSMSTAEVGTLTCSEPESQSAGDLLDSRLPDHSSLDLSCGANFNLGQNIDASVTSVCSAHSVDDADLRTRNELSYLWPEINTSHYFYELPQITEARRLCMLEHEGRSQYSHHLLSSDSSALVDAGSYGTPDTSALPSENSQPVEVAPLSSLPNSLTGLLTVMLEQRSSVNCSRVSSTNSANDWRHKRDENVLNRALPPECLLYQAWQPVNAISTTDLLNYLGLDETDEILSFGPTFSYRDQNSSSSSTAASAPLHNPPIEFKPRRVDAES